TLAHYRLVVDYHDADFFVHSFVQNSDAYNALTIADRHQPGGLTDSSRWLKRSENHRTKSERIRTTKWCENLKRKSFACLSHLAPLRGAVTPAASTGGLRFATTTGYFLATLWVASLPFQI